MLLRASKADQAKDDAPEPVTDPADDLAAALDSVREAIARASGAAGRLSSELGREAGRRSARAGRRGARAAKGAAGKLAEPEQVAELTKKAADKLFPERAKQRREAARKRRRRLLYGGAGLLGAGLVAGWLTAPRRGADVRQAFRNTAVRAGEKGWERVAESRSDQAGPSTLGERAASREQGAEVTQLRQGNGAPNPTRPPTS
jgi:hypothetical protein